MRPLLATLLGGALVLVGACASSGPPATPGDDPAALLEALPPALATVRTAGWWSDAGREGPFRIVITEHGFDHLVSRLHVQWLELVDEETGLRVVSTVGFDQLNEVPFYQLEIAAIRELPNGLEVELTGFSSYTGEQRHFVVRAGAPGIAKLEAPSSAASRLLPLLAIEVADDVSLIHGSRGFIRIVPAQVRGAWGDGATIRQAVNQRLRRG
jgi:hypothetical protein